MYYYSFQNHIHKILNDIPKNFHSTKNKFFFVLMIGSWDWILFYNKMRLRSLFRKNDFAIILTSTSTYKKKCFHFNSAEMTMILLHQILMMFIFGWNIMKLNTSFIHWFSMMFSKLNWNLNDKVNLWPHFKKIATMKSTFCDQLKFVFAPSC